MFSIQNYNIQAIKLLLYLLSSFFHVITGNIMVCLWW